MDEFEKLGRELLRHKYLYYVKAEPEISDYEYDMLERKYSRMSLSIKQEPAIHLVANWEEREWTPNNATVVDFPHDHPWAKEIIETEGRKKYV